jgi:hypothetical protein
MPVLLSTGWSGTTEVGFLERLLEWPPLSEKGVPALYHMLSFPVFEGSVSKPIDVNSRNMSPLDEVTLVLVALADPVRRKVAYCAAIWQAGNGSGKRGVTQTAPLAAWVV